MRSPSEEGEEEAAEDEDTSDSADDEGGVASAETPKYHKYRADESSKVIAAVERHGDPVQLKYLKQTAILCGFRGYLSNA